MLQTYFQHHQSLQKRGGRNVYIFTHTHTQSHKQDYLGKQVLRYQCLSTGSLEQGGVLGNLT